MGKIIAWCLEIKLDDGTIQKVAEIPNGVAQTVDDWLTGSEYD